MNSFIHGLKLLLALGITMNAFGQNLTISSSGEIGTSGTNWSTSGTNPVTITATNTADINTSVIAGYLNNGTSVIVENIHNSGEITLSHAISKTSGAEATLTFRSNARLITTASISSSSDKLNLILWSDYDNSNNDGGIGSSGNITTNGGHVWIGGSNTDSGSLIWNGLTVGDGPSIGSNNYNWNALDLSGTINTSGGDFLAWAGDGYSTGINGITISINTYVNTGTGDIVLITDAVNGANNADHSFSTTGTFVIAPNGGSFQTDPFLWNPVISGNDFEFPGGDFNYLRIVEYANLSGLVIGKYSGTGLPGDSDFEITNSSEITISTTTQISGPISVYGSRIRTLNNVNITCVGDFYLKAINHIDQASGTEIRTNGGNVVYWTSVNGSADGYIRPANIYTDGGHVWMGGNGYTDSGSSSIWHGLTVGTGYSISNLYDGIALRGDIDTRSTLNSSVGGDVYIAGESNIGNYGDVNAEGGTRNIYAGNGDIAILPYSMRMHNGQGHKMNLATSGQISIAPISGNDWWTGDNFNFNGVLNSTSFDGSSNMTGVSIANFASIGGLNLGTYKDTEIIGDTPYVNGNRRGMTLNSPVSIAGPISVYGNTTYINGNLESTMLNAPIRIVSNGTGLSGLTNGLIGVASGKNLTTNGGDIILWSNAQNITSGQANNEIILNGSNTFSTSGGKIVLAGGLDDGSNGGSASDGIPDGYAYRGSYSGEAVDIRSNVTLNSDGGDIIIRGEQNGTDIAVGADATFTISNGGAVTIEGKNTTATSVNLGTANITSTATNAPVSILGTTHLTSGGLVTITTQGGDVLMAANTDDDTDGETTTNGYIYSPGGLSITSNGGDITLGGGDATGSAYAIGNNNGASSGIRIDGTFNLSSGGGDVVLRGKSYSVSSPVGYYMAAGIGFYNSASTTSINSGTGTVLLDGYSQSYTGYAIAGIILWNDAGSSTFTIESANTTSSAITLNGYSTGSTGQAYGIETEANNTLNVLATASGGGITVNTGNSIANYYDAVFRGPVNILAVDGPIAMKGGQLGGVANGYLYFANNVYLGSKASTDVSTSSSDILIQFDRFDFPAGSRFIATDGAVTWQPNGTTFGMAVNSNFFSWNQNSQTMSALTIGKLGNTFDVTHQTPFTVAGPISMYGGRVNIASNLTSSADGDIFLKAISGAAPDIQINSGVTVAKTGGTGTLTLQGHGRVNQHGIVTATAPGVLNVVLWSDFDNDNNDGGTDVAGSITTNGGHVWLGGSNSNGGSYNWNGLTVGDGPSVGDFNNNHHALNLNATITTTGGDLLVWAGNSYSINGIGTVGSGNLINTGSGDITLIADQILGIGPNSIPLQTTGVFYLVPNGGTFPGGLNWNPVLANGHLWFSGSYDYMRIQNVANLGGLVIGRYDGMLDGTDPVVIGNTGNVTFSTATSIVGPIWVYGGDLALNASLTATADNISLYSSGTVTQTAALTANNLHLFGTGDFTLTNTGNSIGTLTAGDAANDVGDLSLVDASGGLTIGDGAQGLSATGTISVETLTGDIIIRQDITTGDSSSSAVLINAGKSSSAGTATGGDIIIMDSPELTMGANGIAKLFSGSGSPGNGLTDFVGSSDNVRLGVDETSTISPSLSAGNAYALYRMNESNITFIGEGLGGGEYDLTDGVLTVSGNENVSISAITNHLQSNPDLTIQVTGNVVFDTSLTATGNLTIIADTDGNQDGDINFNQDISASTLNLEGNSATLEAGKHMNVDGNLVNNTTLVLESNSNSFSTMKVGGSISGSGTMAYNRYVNSFPNNDLVSAPFAGMTFGAMISDSGNDALMANPDNSAMYLFGTYDTATDSWTNFTTTANANQALVAGKGYRAGGNNTAGDDFATFKTPDGYNYNALTTGVDIALDNAGNGWNLVGNPYPTYLSLADVLSANSDVMHQGESWGVYAYNGDYGDGNDADDWLVFNSSNADGVMIAPGQGFFIRTDTDNQNYSFTTAMQSNTGGDDFISGRSNNSESKHIKLRLGNGQLQAHTDIYLNTNGSNGLDVGYDSSLFQNAPAEFALYSHLVADNQGLPMAIQTLSTDVLTNPSTTAIPLGVESVAGTQLTFGIDTSNLPVGTQVFLEDAQNNSFTDLTQQDYVVGISDALSGTGRFYIHLGQNSTLSSNDNAYQHLQVYAPKGSGNIVLSGLVESGMSLELYDLLGRNVMTQELEASNGRQAFEVGHLADGTYVVRLQGNKGSRAVKVVLSK